MNHGLLPLGWEVCVIAALGGCSPNTLEPDPPPSAGPVQVASTVPGDTLIAAADALIRTAAKNSNHGRAQTMQVKITASQDDTTRALVRFDQAAIASAVGSGSLTSAILALPVQESGTDPAGNDIDVHQMLKPWTEAGVTWKCGEDLNLSNDRTDCPETGWKMSGANLNAFQATRTARAHLNPGQAGVARFDVTSDVQAFLSGMSNNGWLVTAGSPTSRAVVWSREAALKPRLVLAVAESTTRPPIPDSPSEPDDSAFTAVDPADTGSVYYRRLYDVVFLDDATDAQVLAFFAKYQASIVGGAPLVDIYTVQVPDPGASFQAVDSLVNAMNGEPGIEVVAPIARSSPKGPLHGRYPNDGAGYTRNSWFTPSALSTWALKAIRAPLAWGCETGTYDTEKVKVAILEQAFVPDPDLPDSLITRVLAPDGRGAAIDPNTVKRFEEHGRAVAGLIGAQGDNNQGTVGLMWRSETIVYELTGPNRLIDNDVRTLERRFVPDLIRRQPRVLSISSEIYLHPARTHNQKLLTGTIDRLLRRVPRLLIIKASGDSSRTLSTEDAKSAWTANAVRASLFQARENGHVNRIIFAAGTQPGDEYWPGSDWISTATEIAAPAKQVGVLPGLTGQLAFGEGTSFAAPLVAGVAAQLLAMDSTLTPAKVKDYILRGAQQPKQDPATGVVPATADSMNRRVLNAPGPVYQLDAYGSLTLLSRERQRTPICGLDVWNVAWLDPSGAITGTVFLGRNAVEPIPLPAGVHGGFLSVAQGGRLLAAQGFSDNDYTQPLRLVQGTWEPLAADPSFMIHYLERDTAYMRLHSPDDRRTDLFVRIGSHYAGRSVAEQRVTATGPDGDLGASSGSWGIAPTGDWILFDWDSHVGDGCGNPRGNIHTVTLYAMPLRGGSPQTVLSSTQDVCAGGSSSFEYASPVAWHNNGSAFIASRQLSDNATQQQILRLRRFNLSGATISQAGATVNQSGVFTSHVRWDPEGGRVRVLEFTSLDRTQCSLVFRSAANLATVLAQTPADGRCHEERSVQPSVRVASVRR